MTHTKHTDSVELFAEKAREYARQYYLVSEENHPVENEMKAWDELLSVHQQQVEEAVRAEQQRIIDFISNEENQQEANWNWPYGWALDAVEKFITNHQD